MKVGEARQLDRARAARAARAADRGRARRAALQPLGAGRRRSRRRRRHGRRGARPEPRRHIFSRVARDLTGGEENAQVPPRVTYDQDAIDGARQARRQRPQPQGPRRRGRLPLAREGQGAQRASQVKRRPAAPAAGPGADRPGRRPRRVKAPVRIDAAEGHPGPARRQVPGAPGRRPHQLQAPPLQEAQARQGVHGGRRRRRLRHPGRALPHPEQGGRTRPGTCPTAPGPATSPARSSRAGCRTTRSRRAGWASSTAPASTAPTRPTRSGSAASHGCIRMAIPDVIELYDQVPVGAPDLHRLRRAQTPISGIGTSSQPRLPPGGPCGRCVECRACR